MIPPETLGIHFIGLKIKSDFLTKNKNVSHWFENEDCLCQLGYVETLPVR